MEYIVTAILGIVLIVIGLSNRKGNISMLHSYHTKRVSEEDRIPFGKLVGLGMIIMGIVMILFSALMLLASYLQADLLTTIANVIMIAGFVIGIGIAFYAMFKYNKGIF